MKGKIDRFKNSVVEYGSLWVNAATQLEVELSGSSLNGFELPAIDQSAIRSVKDIERPLVAQLATRLKLDEAEIAPRLYRRFVRALAQQRWESVAADVQTKAGEVVATSLMVPANEAFAKLTGDELFSRYGHSGKPSEALKVQCNAQPLRAANLWYTELSSVEQKPLFAGFRSATFSFFGETDKGRRQIANRRMARELFQAAVSAAKKLGLVTAGGLKLLSIDLQSPNSTRENLAIERQTTAEHRKALFALRKEEYRGVKLAQLLIFNLPSHHAEFQFGYSHHEDQNGAAVFELIKEAFASNSITAKRLAVAIRSNWLSGEYKTGQAPYRLQAMITLLGFQLGYIVHFNCRSGKDRTGMLDAEVKLLAIQLATGSANWNQVSLDEVEQLYLQRLLLRGGGVEVQQLNTGVPGSKLRPIFSDRSDPLKARLGEAWDEFKGLSHLTGM